MIEQIYVDTLNVLTLEERQIQYEHMFDKKQSRLLIRDRFSEIVDTIEEVEDRNLLCDILGLLALRADRLSIKALIEMLAERLNVETSVDKLMKSIVLLIENDLIEGEIDDKNRTYVSPKFFLKEEDLELLEQYMYKIPMLVEPLPLNQKGNNRGNGYYLNGTDSLILNVHHEYDIDHKVLERFNSIPLTLNISVMKNIRNTWKNMGKSKSSKVNKDTLENFERFEKGVFKVASILINNGNKFYLTHKYDKRGRVYSCGYHINVQSNSYGKSIIEFSNKEIISDEIDFF